jgi:threonine aldolase
MIVEARRVRRMLGAGMRQVGVLAAPGIVALTEMVDRLGEDHARARRLAEGLAELPAIDIDPTCILTNILVFGLRPERVPGDPEVPAAQRFLAGLHARGILVNAFTATEVRMVTHYEIGDTDIGATLRAAREVLECA